jgi:hypothetical protein
MPVDPQGLGPVLPATTTANPRPYQEADAAAEMAH